MEQMAGSIESVVANTESLAAQVEDTSTSITEMGSSIEEVARSIGTPREHGGRGLGDDRADDRLDREDAQNMSGRAESVTNTSMTIERMAASIDAVAATPRCSQRRPPGRARRSRSWRAP